MYELIMLSLLMRFPLNRYQLAKIVNDKLGPYAKLSNGTLYPLVAKLEETGLVTALPQEHQGTRKDRRSRLFHITEAGRLRFQQLMMDTSSFQAEYQRAFLFKVSSLDLLPRANRFYVINHYITYCQAHVLHFTDEAASLAQEIATVSAIPQSFQQRSLTALHHLIAQWQAEATWAMELREEEQRRIEEANVEVQ